MRRFVPDEPKSQAEKFADLARDEDEAAFDGRLKKLAKAPTLDTTPKEPGWRSKS